MKRTKKPKHFERIKDYNRIQIINIKINLKGEL